MPSTPRPASARRPATNSPPTPCPTTITSASEVTPASQEVIDWPYRPYARRRRRSYLPHTGRRHDRPVAGTAGSFAVTSVRRRRPSSVAGSPRRPAPSYPGCDRCGGPFRLGACLRRSARSRRASEVVALSMRSRVSGCDAWLFRRSGNRRWPGCTSCCSGRLARNCGGVACRPLSRAGSRMTWPVGRRTTRWWRSPASWTGSAGKAVHDVGGQVRHAGGVGQARPHAGPHRLPAASSRGCLLGVWG
jgi:hypothetical protein